jgi:hypothetical protein
VGFLRDLGVEVVFAGLALTSCAILAGVEPAPGAATALILRIVVDLVVAAALVLAVTRSVASGASLAAALFLAFAASWAVNGGLEAAVLHGRSIIALTRPLVLGTAVAAVVTGVVLVVMGRVSKWRGAGRAWAPARLLGGLVWAVALAGAYAAFKTLAVVAFRPLLAPAYPHLPLPATYAAVELGRGAIFAAAALPLLLTMAGRRWKNAVVLGFLLAATGAVAPLFRLVDEVPAGVLAVQVVVGVVAAFGLGAGMVHAVLPPLHVFAGGERPAAGSA